MRIIILNHILIRLKVNTYRKKKKRKKCAKNRVSLCKENSESGRHTVQKNSFHCMAVRRNASLK